MKTSAPKKKTAAKVAKPKAARASMTESDPTLSAAAAPAVSGFLGQAIAAFGLAETALNGDPAGMSSDELADYNTLYALVETAQALVMKYQAQGK